MKAVKKIPVVLASIFLLSFFSCLPAVAKPKIKDGKYFSASPGDYGFVVKNNRYYWPGLTEPDSPWKPTSELRQVRAGVVSIGSGYFCLENALPNRSISYSCTRNGWKRLKIRKG